MQKYELNWIVHALSEDIFTKTDGNSLLQLIPERYKTFQLDTLQLHAIHQRMILQLLPDSYEWTQVSRSIICLTGLVD